MTLSMVAIRGSAIEKPAEVAWERYFGAGPDDVKDWAEKQSHAADPFSLLDPTTRAAVKAAGADTSGAGA